MSLQAVLTVKPNNWSSENYSGSIYVNVTLDDSCRDFQDIKNDLRSAASNITRPITRIDRVQHPYAFGRFVLRKEQLEKRNGTVNQEKVFYLIDQGNLAEALEYNLDARRTRHSELNTYSNVGENHCIIVAQHLKTTGQPRDCDLYPTHVIYFS